MSYANITLIGRLGQDPEERTTSTGSAMTTFSVATSKRFKGEEKTLWFKVLAFGKTGENVAKYLGKGSQCAVQGEVDVEEYTNKNGVECRTITVIARDVVFLTKGQDIAAQAKPGPFKPKTVAQGLETFDDIPF